MSIRDYLDPILSILIVIIILVSTWPLLRQASFLFFVKNSTLNAFAFGVWESVFESIYKNDTDDLDVVNTHERLFD